MSFSTDIGTIGYKFVKGCNRNSKGNNKQDVSIIISEWAGGSIYLSKASGRNVAELPVRDFLHEPYPEFNYRTGIELRRKEQEIGNNKYYWDFVFPEDASSLKPVTAPFKEPTTAERN